jgi:hypothetical protein
MVIILFSLIDTIYNTILYLMQHEYWTQYKVCYIRVTN